MPQKPGKATLCSSERSIPPGACNVTLLLSLYSLGNLPKSACTHVTFSFEGQCPFPQAMTGALSNPFMILHPFDPRGIACRCRDDIVLPQQQLGESLQEATVFFAASEAVPYQGFSRFHSVHSRAKNAAPFL